MKEAAQLIGSFGGLVVLAGLSVWTYLKSQTTVESTLKKLDTSSTDMIKALKAISESTAVLKEYIIKHSEQTNQIEKDIRLLLENGMKK